MSVRKNQCVLDCKYKIPTTIYNSIFKSKEPLCSKFQKSEVDLDLEFPFFTEEQLSFFDENFKSYTFPKSSKNGLVIVETRKSKRLEIVLKNIAYYVPNWKLHIFHAPENKNFIKNILKDSIDNVVFHELEIPIKTNQDYNFVIKDIAFWEKLKEHERVLIFQTDSLILRFGIEKFLTYDYIGAPWSWWVERFKDSNRMGGNGGFSIRKVNTMIEIIKKYGHQKIETVPDYHNEDVFFSYHLYNDKTTHLPNWNTAMLFASENFLCVNTLAVHQAWKFHENFKLEFH